MTTDLREALASIVTLATTRHAPGYTGWIDRLGAIEATARAALAAADALNFNESGMKLPPATSNVFEALRELPSDDELARERESDRVDWQAKA